jgi:hypothetical protein
MNQGGAKSQFRMDARPVLLYTASAGAFVLVAALLLLARLVPTLLSVLAVVLLSAAVAAGLAAELLVWRARGIRSVEIDGDALTLYRGRALAAQIVPRASVIATRAVRRWGARTAVLTLKDPAPGKRAVLRIGEEAFPRELFTRFLTILEAWRREVPRRG